jgi:hypothetical protein
MAIEPNDFQSISTSDITAYITNRFQNTVLKGNCKSTMNEWKELVDCTLDHFIERQNLLFELAIDAQLKTEKLSIYGPSDPLLLFLILPDLKPLSTATLIEIGSD